MTASPFPLSRWVTEPTLTGIGREPMVPGVAARQRRRDSEGRSAVAVGAVARRRLGVPAARSASTTSPPTDVDPAPARSTVGRRRSAGDVGAAGARRADLPEHRDAVRRPGAGGARRQPDRRVPAYVHGARVVAPATDVPAGRGSELDGLRLGQRTVRRDRHRQPPRIDVRGDRARCNVGPNHVAIVVPRWSAATWVEDQDQWWMPGLHRSVELVSAPLMMLADTATVPDLDADGTTGRLARRRLRRRSPGGTRGDAAATVEVVVEDPRAGAARRPLATTGRVDVPRWDPADRSEEHVLGYRWPGHRVLDRPRRAGHRVMEPRAAEALPGAGRPA